MFASLELLHCLKAQDIRCYTSFPDKWLGPLLRALDADTDILHVQATIEREALGIAVGAQLAGMRSALVMQNSGIGNILNDWASLACNYRLPVPWMVSDRGSQGEQVTTQMVWHGRLRAILAAAEIPVQTFSSALQLDKLPEFIQYGYDTGQCVAALLPYAFWHDDLDANRVRGHVSAASPMRPAPAAMLEREDTIPCRRATWRRFEALACLLKALTNEWLFVNLGDPCKEVHAIRDRAETFYMLGSMGLVLPLGLGFAQAYAALGGQRKTVVIDGDGSQLMQLGSLGTFAREQPDLALLVIDNGSYGSTGDQPSLTRTHVDLADVARAFGLTHTATVSTPENLEDRLHTILTTPGPSLTVVRVQPGAPATPLVPLAPAAIVKRFQAVCHAGDEVAYTASVSR